MFSNRSTLVIIGSVIVLLGALWMAQGLDLMGGSAMSGNLLWFWVGLALAVVGVGFVGYGLRQRPGPPAG